MTPIVVDAPTAAAGGPTDPGVPESALARAGEASLRMQYAPVPRGRVYRVLIAPARLTALMEPTEDGFVATSPQLGSLGYGSDPASALTDLIERTREYLMMLDEDRPALAPAVAHHARYAPLLRVPETSWFAAVTNVGRGRPGRDAA